MDQGSILMPSDPYEQQLLSLFNSYDYEKCGTLDKDSLTQLCQTLQLEEQTKDFLADLMSNGTQTASGRVTFTEFKNALLSLLTTMQCDTKPELSPAAVNSPEREVCPKYVYGQKRYGRRSRPKTDESDLISTDVTSSSDDGSSTLSADNQIDPSEVLAKKRRPNGGGTNLQLPQSVPPMSSSISNIENNLNVDCLNEDLLRRAWERLGVGKDGFLKRNELILVCDAIGLHKLTDTVIRHLFTDDSTLKISVEDVLEVLRQDDIWTNILQQDNEDNIDDHCCENDDKNLSPRSTTSDNGEVFTFDKKIFHCFNLLDPKGCEEINTDMLLDIWENSGITNSKELLYKLGYTTTSNINLIDLTDNLQGALKKLQDNVSCADEEEQMFKSTLLQANLCLHQIEIQYLNHVLEQMCTEREKLRGDVVEANNRAKLLALEIDDNHVKMENSTLTHVKMLEHRHLDAMKLTTEQHAREKDTFNTLNQQLETRIGQLESDIEKLKSELQLAHKYSSTVEKENSTLSAQIDELQDTRTTLTEQIGTLQLEKRQFLEMEQEQMEPLLKQLSTLHMENTQLRDTNDEMITQIETLKEQMVTLAGKGQSTVNNASQFIGQDEDTILNETIERSETSSRRGDYVVAPSINDDLELARLETRVKDVEKDKEDLQQKCTDLENCVDLLRNEYEKCEDYWQHRLNEERQMFEQEQEQNSDKLRELFVKMAEYEQQFTQQANQLPPIEETEDLEKQFTDLEQEFEDYKQQCENTTFQKDEEIANLKYQLAHSVKDKEAVEQVDYSVQVDSSDISTRIGRFTICMAESTNVFSSETQPSSSDSGSSPLRKSDPIQTATRPIRHRKHERNDSIYKEVVAQREEWKANHMAQNTTTGGSTNSENVVTMPLATIRTVYDRLHHLEQRCRQLQITLKQQHFYTEQSLQQCYQRHSGEKVELQSMLESHQKQLDHQIRTCNEQLERLTRSDMLVKELYVENSYLVAKIQRLQQQCDFLAQCNNKASSSV